MATRSEVRKQRYKLLKDLGYSATEARRLRDQSHDNIQTNIQRTERRIARIPAIDRSPAQQQRLRRIRDYKRESRREPAETRARTETKSQRIENFRTWSLNRSFPPEVLQLIRRLNRESGRRPNSAYGFRIFYHMYISGESEAMSKRRFNSERFERRDT